MSLNIRRVLKLLLALPLVFCVPHTTSAQKFYPDDPLWTTPPPRDASGALSRKLSDYYDFLSNTFAELGEEQPDDDDDDPETGYIPARDVNTLGEVHDGGWYVNRHYRHPMTIDDLVRGVGDTRAPSLDGPWTVIAGKTEGITPGFTIRDSSGRRYVVKFDPLSNPEIATAAEVISSKFFHALGYHVPENYLVEFNRDQLRVGDDVQLRDSLGQPRPMTERDITEILLNVPRTASGDYRAVASLFIEGRNLGPFRYYGVRKDDPNDIVPHEHRRDLRGLGVFAAWLNHDDSRSINTQDFLATQDGVPYVKHYLIDFGSTLGSASNGANSPRSGFEYLFTWRPALLQTFTFGLVVPSFARADYPRLPSVGRFESERFSAESWVPEYRNAAFANRLPDDAFWAAKQVMNFSDAEIRAIVRTGRYSDPAAEKWVAETLIIRRDKIGRAFLTKVLPLDRFAIRDGSLVFEDLAATHGLQPPQSYSIQWFHFDNRSRQMTPPPGAASFALPPAISRATPGEYFASKIQGADPQRTITVYLRKLPDHLEVAGIERSW